MPDSELPIIDNTSAPEIFASGRICYSMIGAETLIITFTNMRWCPEENTGKNVVVSRMVLPVHKAQALVLGLNTFLEQRGQGAAAVATAGLVKQ